MYGFAGGVHLCFGEIYNRPGAGEYYVPQTSDVTEPVHQGSVLTQNLICPYDKLRSLWLYFDGSQTQYSVMYVVSVYSDNKLLFQNDFKTADVTSPVNILLSPLTGIQGKTLTLKIEVGRTTADSAVPFYLAQSCTFASPAQLDGQVLSAPLAVQLNVAGSSLGTYYFLLVAAGLLLALILLLLGRDARRNTAVLLVGMGLFVAAVNPLGDVPDESSHMMRAETVSQGLLFCHATTEYHADDALYELVTTRNAAANNFVRFSDVSQYAAKMGQSYTAREAGNAGNYFFVGYLASALGLLLGRLFRMSAMLAFYLGRALNVLVYAALCTAAVAVTPRFKRLLGFVACFPLTVFLASSYSPDGITCALILLCIALLLRMCDSAPGTVTLTQTGGWMLLCLCAGLTRIAYALLLFLIFVLPASAYKNKKGRRLVCVQLAVAVALAALWTSMIGYSGLRTVGGASASGQIAFLLTYPGAGLNALLGTMTREALALYSDMFALGWMTYRIDWLGILLPFLLLHIAAAEEAPVQPLDHPVRRTVVLMTLIYLVTYLGMYISSNVVGIGTVLGVQGRYFIEMLALSPLLLCGVARGKKIWDYTPACCGLFLFCSMISAMFVRQYM